MLLLYFSILISILWALLIFHYPSICSLKASQIDVYAFETLTSQKPLKLFYILQRLFNAQDVMCKMVVHLNSYSMFCITCNCLEKHVSLNRLKKSASSTCPIFTVLKKIMVYPNNRMLCSNKKVSMFSKYSYGIIIKIDH